MDRININDLALAIRNHMVATSRFEKRRNYLGMSKLGNCPRMVYRIFKEGDFTSSPYTSARMAHIGYTIEESFCGLLVSAGLAPVNSSVEFVSRADNRIRGHSDGELRSGEMFEIASVSTEGFERTASTHRIKTQKFFQMQAYMHFSYGRYDSSIVFCVCRETFEFHPVRITYNIDIGNKLEAKAMMILSCADRNEPPACECGKCR